MRRIILLLTLALAVLATGCATGPNMLLAEEASKLDPSKPLFLMSVTVKNNYQERWKPRIQTVVLEKDGVDGKPEKVIFRMDGKGAIASETGDTTYLVRFPTESLPTIVRGFNAMGSAFPIHGRYFVPLHANLGKSEAGIYYLGSIQAVIRERKDNEFKAGPSIPLLDQAIVGASSGTFDIEISDAYDTDIALFRKTFPALKEADIMRSVLPKWDRAKAQLYWEQN